MEIKGLNRNLTPFTPPSSSPKRNRSICFASEPPLSIPAQSFFVDPGESHHERHYSSCCSLVPTTIARRSSREGGRFPIVGGHYFVLERGTTGELTQGFEMILGSLCVLIAACWSNFLVEFATIKFASVVRFLLVRIEVLLDGSSPASIGHRVLDGIVLLLALRVGANVLLWVSGFNSKGMMRLLCEIRDHLRFREDLGILRLPPKSKPYVGGYKGCSGGDRDRGEDGGGRDDGKCYPEDKEFDVRVLRRLVKTERRRADKACNELEKERAAAASAIDETMAMIARLQGEKNASEVRANQERRMSEQKQAYDQEVIESLRWMIARCEDRRDVLEGRLSRWGRKLEMSDNDKDKDDDADAALEDEAADKETSLMEESLSVDDDDHHRDVMIISLLEFDSLHHNYHR